MRADTLKIILSLINNLEIDISSKTIIIGFIYGWSEKTWSLLYSVEQQWQYCVRM